MCKAPPNGHLTIEPDFDSDKKFRWCFWKIVCQTLKKIHNNHNKMWSLLLHNPVTKVTSSLQSRLISCTVYLAKLNWKDKFKECRSGFSHLTKMSLKMKMRILWKECSKFQSGMIPNEHYLPILALFCTFIFPRSCRPARNDSQDGVEIGRPTK